MRTIEDHELVITGLTESTGKYGANAKRRWKGRQASRVIELQQACVRLDARRM